MQEDAQEHKHEHIEAELEDLKNELRQFEKEKERIRAIVGQVGGVPKFQARIINTLFIVIMVISVVISVIAAEKWRLLMIELATVTLSIKIIYLIHAQMRVAHFEFWILSSLEWRVNDIVKQLRQLKKQIEKD